MKSKRKIARVVGVLILLAYSLLGSDNPDLKITKPNYEGKLTVTNAVCIVV